MRPLIAQLSEDIRSWLASPHKVFTNERDLQVRLALYLERSEHYDLVDTEYRVPLEELKAKGLPVEPDVKNAKIWQPDAIFPWNNHMSVDIVVAKEDVFAGVELKYATREIKGKESIFGEPKLTDVSILKDQAASNLTMYNYWKDVRRLEMLTSLYNKVAGGVALLVTNSRDFWNEPRDGAKYGAFSMHNGNAVGPGLLAWPAEVSESVRDKHPDFRLARPYPCRWEDTSIKDTALNGDKFRYIISQVKI